MTAMVLTSVASVCIFLLVFWRTKIVATARQAIATTQAALQTMRDPALDDLVRERTIQSAAIELVGASASLIWRSAVALVAAFIPIVAVDRIGIVDQSIVMTFMARWDVIIVATAIITLGYVIGLRLWSR